MVARYKQADLLQSPRENEKGSVIMEKMMQGQVAIITGGASGMGEATAKLFAQEGAKVVIADYNEKNAQKVADEINAAGGIARVYPPLDLRLPPGAPAGRQRPGHGDGA